MNELTQRLTTDYKPMLALVVYSSDETFHADYYLESHHINEAGQLMEGRPLKQETIDGIVDFFYNDNNNHVNVGGGIIPTNLIQFEPMPGSRYKMAWYRPAEIRHLFFAESLHLQSGAAWVPATLYVTNGKELDVFALANDQRPEADTPLMYAPFHNVYSSGKVCLGSAKVNKPTAKTYENLMKYWEDLFWLSEFTSLHNTNPTASNLNMLWDRLVKDNSIKWEMLAELKPAKRTLKQVLS